MDHLSVVADSQAALEATARFGLRHFSAAKWEPDPKSEAAAELSNSESRQDGTSWGEDPPRTAYAAANLMMTGVLDNLESIRRLLGPKMPVIGPTIIARSAIEITSGVWWLMEPGIGVRRRVCRELALSLTSARRTKQIAKEFKDAGFELDEAMTDAFEQETRVLQRITDLGINPPTSSGFSPSIEGEQAMNATDATAAMFKPVLRLKMPGEFVYRSYSATTHGEIYGLTNFVKPHTSSDGSTLLHWHLSPDVLDSTVQLAIVAFERSYLRINKVMGWGKLEGDLWEIKLRKIYGG